MALAMHLAAAGAACCVHAAAQEGPPAWDRSP